MFLSCRIRPYFIVAATLALPLCALGQPAEREVIIIKGMAMPPDPKLITPEELQTLTGGPTLVTYSGAKVPAKGAIQALLEASKSTSPFLNLGAELKTISVDWKDTPFWSAARELETKAEGRWESDYKGGVFLRPDNLPNAKNEPAEPGLNGLCGVQTPFVRIYAGSVTRSSVDKIFLGEKQRLAEVTPVNINLALNAYFDPKLEVRSRELRDLKFQSKQDGPITETPRTFWGYLNTRQKSPVIEQNIAMPAVYAKQNKLFRISGVLHTTIVSASETWKVPDLAAADKTPHAIAGGQYTIESSEIQNEQLVLKLSAITPADQKLQTANIPFSTLKVRNSRGQELNNVGASADGRGDKTQSELRFNLRADNNEISTGPYSLEWSIPSEFRSLDVPFEFRDVPLP